MRTTLLCTILCALAHAADPNAIDLKAPEIALWPNGAPGSEGVTAAHAGHVANLAMRGNGVWMG
jgi:hypothetical protein